jgi:3'(2'), 5'-bisphosphate nucleotidase
VSSVLSNRQAGRAIIDVYHAGITVTYKDDAFLLTEADKCSHEILERSLRDLTPDIPVCSEKGLSVPYVEVVWRAINSEDTIVWSIL